MERRPINHIVEADIKGFFDNVNQEWLLKFLGHRVGDRRIHRMVKRILKAGVSEDGSVAVSDDGTPQGGVISPLLANIYLLYALGLWFERVYRKRCMGYARLIRYADDFVVCFQYKVDAERFREELVERLGKFSLEVEPTKTKVIEFGRFAVRNAKQKGRRAETFDFLGLTHYCGTRRYGNGFRMKRVTARKKFVAKLKAFKEWIKSNRTLPTKEIWKTTICKLRGHYNYYGVTDSQQPPTLPVVADSSGLGPWAAVAATRLYLRPRGIYSSPGDSGGGGIHHPVVSGHAVHDRDQRGTGQLLHTRTDSPVFLAPVPGNTAASPECRRLCPLMGVVLIMVKGQISMLLRISFNQ